MTPARALALLASAALVAQLLLLPEPAFVPSITAVITDKALHALVFGALAAMLWMLSGGRAPWAVFAAVLGIGVLDELHQFFIPGREADPADLLADAAGAALALYLMKTGVSFFFPPGGKKKLTPFLGA
jgi:VanZ family protein